MYYLLTQSGSLSTLSDYATHKIPQKRTLIYMDTIRVTHKTHN